MSNLVLLPRARSPLIVVLQAQGWPTPPTPKPRALPGPSGRTVARRGLSTDDMLEDGYVWYRGSWWKREKAIRHGWQP